MLSGGVVKSLPGVSADLIDTNEISTEDWLERRKGFVGASEVAGIVGLSPWESPWSVWLHKTGLGKVNKDEFKSRMITGKRMEKAISPWFSDEMNLKVIGEQYIDLHQQNTIAGATLDGLVCEEPDLPMLGLLEMKTDQWKSPEEWEVKIPDHYQCQGQWQMYVTGLQQVWFAVMFAFHMPLGIYRLERDDQDIDFLVNEVGQFWEKNVLAGEPPATDGHQATLDAIAARWPKYEPDKEADLSGLEATIEDLERAKEAKRLAKSAEDAAKAKLLERIRDAEIGVLNGNPVFRCPTQTKTTVETKELFKDHPYLRDQYAKTSTYRVLKPITSKRKTNVS